MRMRTMQTAPILHSATSCYTHSQLHPQGYIFSCCSCLPAYLQSLSLIQFTILHFWQQGWRQPLVKSIPSTQVRTNGHYMSNNWDMYLQPIGLRRRQKRAIFLSVIGVSTYKLLSSLLALAKPGEKSHTFLIDKLSKHFTPAPSKIVERFKFHTRFRKPGESITAFVSELCSLAKSCNFRDTMETMLRDHIACGINDTIIQHCLLSEKEWTLLIICLHLLYYFVFRTRSICFRNIY